MWWPGPSAGALSTSCLWQKTGLQWIVPWPSWSWRWSWPSISGSWPWRSVPACYRWAMPWRTNSPAARPCNGEARAWPSLLRKWRDSWASPTTFQWLSHSQAEHLLEPHLDKVFLLDRFCSLNLYVTSPHILIAMLKMIVKILFTDMVIGLRHLLPGIDGDKTLYWYTS